MEKIEYKIITLATVVVILFTALVVVLSARSGDVVRGNDDKSVTSATAPGSVDLSRLAKKSPEYPGVKKNVFSPLRTAAPVRQQTKTPVAVAPEPTPQPVVVSKVRLFVNMLEFMGSLDNEDGVTVFIAFKDDVYLLKEGQKVDAKLGDFSLLSVSESSIDFVDDSSGERASIMILEAANDAGSN